MAMAAAPTPAGDAGAGGGGGVGVAHVGTPAAMISALPLLCMACLFHRLDLGASLRNSLLVGVARCFVQLSALGWVLRPIFTWGVDRPWLVGLCELTFGSFAFSSCVCTHVRRNY